MTPVFADALPSDALTLLIWIVIAIIVIAVVVWALRMLGIVK